MTHFDPELPTDFRDFIIDLNAHHVEYVLVGGYAVTWHGFARGTADIDFLYDNAAGNVRRLCAALTEFGAPDEVIDPEFLALPDAVSMFGRPPFRIDLLASISGVSYKEVRSGAIPIQLDGQRVLVIGLPELTANKSATSRAKDREDVRRLNQIGAAKRSRPRRRKSR